MWMRLIIAAATLCGAIALYGATSTVRQPWPALAVAGLGERFYAVRLKHVPVGQLVQSAERGLDGSYIFSSRLEFQLDRGQPVRVFETKRFAGVPPFQLLTAEQRDTTAAATNQVSITQTGKIDNEQPIADDAPRTSYSARVARGTEVQEKNLQWQHRLSDYLAVEHWLSGAEVNSKASFTSLDFDHLGLRKDAWTLLARSSTGFEVAKSSRLEATRLFLDQNFKPLRFSMAGTFEIETVKPEDLPISPEPVFHSKTYQIPLDKPIKSHQTLKAMTLKVTGNTALVERWANATKDGLTTLLRARAETERSTALPVREESRRYTREELSYPLSAPQVAQLARLAADSSAPARVQANQLTHFVYNYINYDHHSTMQNVLDVIESRRGDCNEYAELFTTLGRALGLPVRTVIGLAYTDEYAPAFALHAWNEVLIEDRWISFDPTWDQTRVDATHLPLPDDASGMLQGITSMDELSFKVHSLSYQ